jgi:hypothetical protein
MRWPALLLASRRCCSHATASWRAWLQMLQYVKLQLDPDVICISSK